MLRSILMLGVALFVKTVAELQAERAQTRREKKKLLRQAKRRDSKIDKLTRWIRRKIRKQDADLPDWLPSKYGDLWRKPWTSEAAGNADFKIRIWARGFVSPNFTRAEASGKHRHPLGSDVPDSLRGNCQYHAFKLEIVRHDCGDKPMGPLSWYRDDDHNSSVGGASLSQHKNAWGTDWSDAERARLGASTFDDSMHRVFANGGRGTVAGTRQIRHVDNGPARTWVYG